MKKTGILWLGLILCVVGGYFLWLKREPMVSVVMPVYNRENYVKEALDSVLNQSFQDFEIVVVDDGSTDKTPQILAQYAEKDNRIRVFTHETNCGVGCARNTAQSHANGKYLVIMDSDDVMVPQRLERQVRAMEENPDIDALTGRLVNLADPFEQSWAERPFEYHISQPDNGFMVCLFFANCFGNVSSIIRHSFIKKHDIKYKEQVKVGEDYDYWLQMTINDGKLAYMKDVAVRVRRHNNRTMSNYKNVLDGTYVVKRRYFDMFDVKNIDVKWDYSIKEKCDILSQMVATNNKKKIMNSRLNFAYEKMCATKYAHKFFVEHIGWSDILIVFEKGRVKRSQKKDEVASYVLKDDNLIITWDKWGTETFVLSDDGMYVFEDENRISAAHKEWKSYLNISGNKICWKTKKNECGTVLKRTNDEIVIKWDRWGTETFRKNPKTKVFECVEQPPHK